MFDRKQNCNLEILEVETGKRKILKTFDKVIEAPNWSKDGKYLVYNSEGLIYKFDLETSEITKIDTDFVNACNNDHVISSDGKSLAISNNDVVDNRVLSKIYVVDIEGGLPELITEEGPSYLHGWSPDGDKLSYVAMRNSKNFNIFEISIKTREEVQITKGDWNDDGCEYNTAGDKIWFNSTRTGLMQIWCMNADGSDQVQMLDIHKNCWFPHISPDDKQVVYIAYKVGDLEYWEHLPDLDVELRIMDSDGKNDRLLAELHGGQGTINVNSWSPDSKNIAFVSYF